MPVAIERPDGRLVDLLLEAGHPVVPVKPNAIKTWRDGEVLSGAKSDAGDAAVIAEYLRLRAHKLRIAAPYSDQTRALRTVVRTRGDLVEMRVAATNQLSALLDAHWPGAKAIFADVESPISLEFLTRYPTPAAAAHLGEKRMAAFLLKHGYSGRRTAAELLARLRAAPAGTAAKSLDRGAARRRARRGRRPHGPERGGEKPRPLRRRPPRGAPGRRDLHVAAKVGSDQRRPGARRVGRLPAQAYEHPDSVAALAGVTPVTKAIRQTPLRAFPLGLQQALPRRDHHLRRQQPPRQPLGREDLQRRPRQRQRPPARHPHPGPRLDPRHLPLLARRHPLRPSQARRRRRTRQPTTKQIAA